MEYQEFIKAELLVLVPVLLGLGKMLKGTEKVKDNYIPLILTGVSLALSCLYVLGVDGVSTLSLFTAIVQGVLCAAGAVYGNQMYKQTSK